MSKSALYLGNAINELSKIVPKIKHQDYNYDLIVILIVRAICDFASGIRGNCLNANISSGLNTESKAFVPFYNELVLGTDEDNLANIAIRLFEHGDIIQVEHQPSSLSKEGASVFAIESVVSEDRSLAFLYIARYAEMKGFDIVTWVKLRLAYERQQ